MQSARSLLIATSVIAGLAEIGMAIQFATSGDPDDAWPPAAIFAVAFLALAWLARSDRRWPAIPLGILFLLELAFLPAYEWNTAAAIAEQGAFAIVSAIGLIAAVAVFTARNRRRARD
jgi:MYXO-CTERM domain-containing protein